ncbi:ABC transporter permease [Lachnospiraceae bacterium 29-84]
MDLNKNNNGTTIYRIAKNNLLAKKMPSFFSMLSILLAITLVSALSLFMVGTQTAEKNMLGQMQHVMYQDVTDEQIQRMALDDRMERCDPYKELEKEFQIQGVKYRFFYNGSYVENVKGYRPVEGKDPQHYGEILVDKAFMRAIGREAVLGETIDFEIGGETQEFTICGYTDGNAPAAAHPIHVSKAFADQSPLMKDLPYTALVRINGVTDVPASTFTTIAYQIAMDYQIERPNVNLNGKFEESLQKGNTGIYFVLFVSAILFIASSIVIYSIFYLSVAARVQQIGQLQTIGMTEKQVKQMIRREGLLLSALAIPIGLLLGGIVSYLLIPDGWTFQSFCMVALCVGVLGILTVQISVRKPASIASKFSPIEASRNVGTVGKGRPNGRHKMLTPYVLARMECKNHRKRWWFTTASLAFGGIIFMVAATWVVSWDEEQYAREGLFNNSEYYISYLYHHSTPKPYGITEFQLTGHLGGELERSIREIPNVKDVHMEEEVFGNVEYKGVTFLQGFYPVGAEDTEYYKLPSKGNNTYQYMVQHDAILITDSAISENINGITFEAGEKIEFRYFDGEEHTVELEIGAVSQESAGQYGNRPNFCIADKTVEKLWGAMNTTSSFSISVEDYEENGGQVEAALRALLDGYEDLSLSTLREEEIQVSGQIKQIQMQIYGISIFIILFSIFNLINTVISSIVSRKRELSMLESIGMEERQVRNMLFWESFFLALPNLLLTLTLGTAAGFAFISLMQKSAGYLEYHFPALPAVLYMAGMIGIPMLISLVCLKRQNNISLVERIKNED